MNQLKECPSCKVGGVVARTNRYTGMLFIGCNQFPNCKWSYSQPLDASGMPVSWAKSIETVIARLPERPPIKHPESSSNYYCLECCNEFSGPPFAQIHNNMFCSKEHFERHYVSVTIPTCDRSQ